MQVAPTSCIAFQRYDMSARMEKIFLATTYAKKIPLYVSHFVISSRVYGPKIACYILDIRSSAPKFGGNIAKIA